MATNTTLLCEICRGPYRKPKILSCFHSFCEACLEFHIAKAKPDPKFQCPLCLSEIEIPENGARSLQNNFYIETAEEKKQEDADVNIYVLCENCVDERRPQAIKYCCVCQQNICENCVFLHEKLKTTRSHDLVTLEQMENQKRRIRLCTKHETEVAERYCFTCEEFVCRICGHKDHVVLDTDIAVARRKKDVQRLLEESETYFHLVQHRLKVIQNLKSMVEMHETKVLKKLETIATERKEEINRVVESLSLQVKQLCDKEISEIDMMKWPIALAHENNELTKNWILHATSEEILVDSGRKKRKIMETNAALPSYFPPISVVTFTGKPSPDLSASGILEVKTRKTCTVDSIKIEHVKTFGMRSKKRILFIVQHKEKQVCMAQEGIEGLSIYMEDGTWKGDVLIDHEISAVGLDCDSNLLACVNKENIIYKISGEHILTKLYTLAIFPGSICVCPDGRVVVLQKSSKTLFFLNSSDTESHMLLNPDHFNSIQCIAICKYTNILAVGNKSNTCSGADFDYKYDTVHLFDHRGQNVKTLGSLEVFCIVSDNRGHFLLGGNNKVIIIDTRGNILVNLVCVQQSFYAFSLAVDTADQLWIGGMGQISIFKYPDFGISVIDTQDIDNN
ncbi:hypothetical protein ACJMK2_041468 [Sinanodonta woodiana]|uniref:TRIM56 n=1 Tax=Sinanodonta woodiana TaxID=1069815 RepID=A0ABD3W5M3_SINWO